MRQIYIVEGLSYRPSVAFASREAAEAVARLEEQFPEEYAGLLEELLDACARREDLMLEHAFRVGFSTAVRLLVESFAER